MTQRQVHARFSWLCLAACALTLACEPNVEVDAAAEPPVGTCELAVTPPSIDYGTVSINTVATASVTVRSVGTNRCLVSLVAIDGASDSEFSVDNPPPANLILEPGVSWPVVVSFHAQSRDLPRLRTGTLDVQSNDPNHPAQTVALVAKIDIGCDLAITPNPLNFGNLALNIVQTDQLALQNNGTRDCVISQLALAPNTDPDFTLAIDQITAFTLSAGQSASIPVTFEATGAPPNLRTGALDFILNSTSQTVASTVSIPLQGYIDTECTSASELIYTVDDLGLLASFDPTSLTFTQIGHLNCPTHSTTFSMAVDQHAIAWVEYMSGEIFRVDTRDASCTATTFQPGQLGFDNFGMGFLFQPSTGVDTLYIAGGAYSTGGNLGGPTELGTISFPDLTVHSIAPVSIGWPELTGTGDGQLWGFVPPFGSVTGVATLAQFDPTSGATLHSYSYPEITSQGGWAMKFYGGSFWIFLGNSVYAVSRDTAALTLAIDGTSPDIVGAGVSTCAPLHPTGTRSFRRDRAARR